MKNERVMELEKRLDEIPGANLSEVKDFFSAEPVVSVIVKPNMTDIQRINLLAAVRETAAEFGLKGSGTTEFGKISVRIHFKR